MKYFIHTCLLMKIAKVHVPALSILAKQVAIAILSTNLQIHIQTYIQSITVAI